MIKITNNIDDIISLWQEAFGDTREDILFFADNLKHGECIALYDNEIVSMLYLVDCKVDYKASKYIYAACTSKKYRSNGAMTRLLDYCKEKYESVCLIPANEGLISYYKKRNFDKAIDISSVTFDECDEICDYLFEGCELNNPFGLMYIGD